jgi:hypothetical protein
MYIGCFCFMWCICFGACYRTMYYCRCVTCGAADSYVSKCLYSTCESFGCSCILDPTGVLNWLAIAYN